MRGDNLALAAVAGIRVVRTGGGGNHRKIRRGRVDSITAKTFMWSFTLFFFSPSDSVKDDLGH